MKKERATTFGFPAYFTQVYAPDAKAPDALRAAVHAALANLNWTVRDEHGNELVASTGMGLRSWGERIVLTFQPDGSVCITSKCSLPTQCLDWGKNQSNVRKFIEQMGSNG